MVYLVPPTNFCKRFLKLLMFIKLTLTKGRKIILEIIFIFTFSNAVTKARCNKLFTCLTVNVITENNIQHWTRGNAHSCLKLWLTYRWGVMQEVSHSKSFLVKDIKNNSIALEIYHMTSNWKSNFTERSGFFC